MNTGRPFKAMHIFAKIQKKGLGQAHWSRCRSYGVDGVDGGSCSLRPGGSPTDRRAAIGDRRYAQSHSYQSDRPLNPGPAPTIESTPTPTPVPAPSAEPTAPPTPISTSTPTPTPEPTATPAPELQTAQEALDAASAAMASVETGSVRMEIESTLDGPIFFETKIVVHGDFQAPDRSRFTTVATSGGSSLEYDSIVIGMEGYQENPFSGVWEASPDAFIFLGRSQSPGQAGPWPRDRSC